MSAVPSRSGQESMRAMMPADAPAGAALSRAVGWLHREEDWQLVIGLGDGVVIERDGEAVATALSWPFGETHANLGMIIVAPKMQGAGLGKLLMAQLLAQTEGRSQLLTATEAGRPLYEKVGFVACGEVYQHQGLVGAVPDWQPAAGETIRAAGRPDLETLCRLDRAATGLDRSRMLAALIEVGEAVVLERGGEAVAFSILRRFGKGEVVGPVIAPDARLARAVIGHWLDRRQGQRVRLDLTQEPGLDGWLTGTGLARVSSGLSMVRGALPVTEGPARRFALVNQALC